MIVSNLKLENIKRKIAELPHDYILLNTNEFQYREDRLKFERVIEVLNLIKTIHWANEFYKGVNSDLRIETDIFHKVIDAGFTNQSFNTEELTTYFNAMILVDGFYFSMLKFNELDNYTPYELEFVLFGFSIDEQESLTSKQTNKLHNTYGNLFYDVRMKNLDVKTFIDKIKNEIEELRKVVLEEINKPSQEDK